MNSNRWDFSHTTSTRLIWLLLPLGAWLISYAPDSWGYENGILENTQNILLMLSILFCVTAKQHKSLYLFFATVCLFLLLREVNCGRVLLWSRSGEIFHCGPVQDYLKWKEIPHGSVIRIAVYTFMGLLCLTAFCRKGNLCSLYHTLIRTRIPVWETAFLIIGLLVGVISERANICFIAEEMGEILMYSAFTSAIYRYSRGIQTPILPKN